MSPLRSRVRGNDEWFARCARSYADENRSNGQFARKCREKSGLSLRALAKRMGISAPFLSDLERGNRQWSDEQCRKWEAAMPPENASAHATRTADGRPEDTPRN